MHWNAASAFLVLHSSVVCLDLKQGISRHHQALYFTDSMETHFAALGLHAFYCPVGEQLQKFAGPHSRNSSGGWAWGTSMSCSLTNPPEKPRWSLWFVHPIGRSHLCHWLCHGGTTGSLCHRVRLLGGGLLVEVWGISTKRWLGLNDASVIGELLLTGLISYLISIPVKLLLMWRKIRWNLVTARLSRSDFTALQICFHIHILGKQSQRWHTRVSDLQIQF